MRKEDGAFLRCKQRGYRLLLIYVGQKYDAMIEYEDGKYHILPSDRYGNFKDPQEYVEISNNSDADKVSR